MNFRLKMAQWRLMESEPVLKFLWWFEGWTARIVNRCNSARASRVFLYVFEQGLKACYQEDLELAEYYKGALDVLIGPIDEYWAEYEAILEKYAQSKYCS